MGQSRYFIGGKFEFLTNRYIKGYYSTMPIFQQIKYTAYHKVIILQITFSSKTEYAACYKVKKGYVGL